MNTWQAILVHLGIGALEFVTGAQSQKANATLANPAIQFPAQIALLALHGAVATKNSNTDPNGNKLVPLATGEGFVSSKK